MSYRRFAALLPLALLLAVLLAGCQDHPLPTAAPVTPGETPLLLQVPAFTYEEVSANYHHTCARKSDGSVVCWGWNLHQQTSVPTSLGAVTQVSAGSSHTCAIRQSDSKVACWGQFLRSGSTSIPPDLGAVTQVRAGGNHTCAIRQSDGNAVCWGDNSVQQRSVPPSLGAVRQVATGWDHTCAIRQSDDNVVCWGWNSNGQRDVPANLGAVTQVGAGSLYTCAIRQSDGNVVCWGGNEFGETNVPAGLGAVAQIEAGSEHACAVKSNGSVACWGWNSNGQTNVPADLGSVTQVGAGQKHTCVRKSDGNIACWGDNSEGRLNVPARPTITVYPTAIFSAPATVVVEETFTLTLSDAQVPGHPQATTFTYAFDCGDGSGLGAFGTSNAAICPTVTVGTRTVRGIVRDQEDGQTAYTGTVEVLPPPDDIPPVITASISGTLGQNGWYTSDVTVSWTVVDLESPVSSQTGCDDTTISTDTGGITLTCEATSAGGTASQNVTIKRDATAPTLNPSVSPNPVLLGGSATATPGAADATSGLASSSCGSVDASSVGTKTVTCTATDHAGNQATQTHDYRVIYQFNGFEAPIDNGVRNVAKAGRTIPLKWRLTDANGNAVTNLGSAQVSFELVPCEGGTPEGSMPGESPGGSGLQNLGNGHYQFNWKTATNLANTCGTMHLNLGGGDTRTALFRFTR